MFYFSHNLNLHNWNEFYENTRSALLNFKRLELLIVLNWSNIFLHIHCLHVSKTPPLFSLLLTAHTALVTAVQRQTVHNYTLLITWLPSHVLLQPAQREEPFNYVDQAFNKRLVGTKCLDYASSFKLLSS